MPWVNLRSNLNLIASMPDVYINDILLPCGREAGITMTGAGLDICEVESDVFIKATTAGMTGVLLISIWLFITFKYSLE